MDFDFRAPRHFLPLFYTSHDLMAVECDGPDWVGGDLFEWFISDVGPCELMYRSIEDWLEVLVVTLRERAFEPLREHCVLINNERHREIAAAKLATHGPHPVLGTNTTVDRELRAWPEEWRLRSGIEPDRAIPEDEISTIRDALRESRHTNVSAHVRGRVLRAHGHVVIDDDTGQLQVVPPPSTSHTQPRLRSEYVFDVEIPARGEPTPPLRTPDFHMNPLRQHNYDIYKLRADAVATRVQLVSDPPGRFLRPGAIRFERLTPQGERLLPEVPTPEVGSIADLLRAIPGLLVRCIPPRRILNDLLRRGIVEA